MATGNPFDLLGDDDNDDPSQLIAAVQQQKVAATATAAPAAGGKKSPAAPAAEKMPTKPVPPSQAVREARNLNSGPPRGGAGRGGPGRGRGGRGGAGIGPNRDFGNGNENGFTGGYGGSGGAITEEGDGGKPLERSRGGYGPPRQSFRGGRRGGYGSADGEGGGDTERPPRRVYERRSGTGRGYEMKREGAGRANWGTVNDDVLAQETEENVNVDEKVMDLEKQPEQEDGKPVDGDKDSKENAATEEAKPEDKEMTLDEYEKIREEKRKALLAMKAEERKVVIDKELEKLQPLSLRKDNDEIFIKLGADKESKKKEAEREERAKKHLSINEFLKPAEGERYFGGRGRGRGRGDRGGRGGFGGGGYNTPAAPAIEDPGQFPTLGGK